VIRLVIVAKQMQQAMEREHAILGQIGMARLARLPPRHTSGDDDVTQEGDSGFGIRDWGYWTDAPENSERRWGD
jgi:hypothetical protein